MIWKLSFLQSRKWLNSTKLYLIKKKNYKIIMNNESVNDVWKIGSQWEKLRPPMVINSWQ